VGVQGFTHSTRRKKFIGKNARRDDHGSTASEPVVRIFTDRGVRGVGFGRITPQEAQGLIGRSLSDIWHPASGMRSALGRADHALFDLVGKILRLPIWQLLGARGPAAVPVYDTTLYFYDLLPDHALRGIGRLVDELEQGLELGFRQFKVKVGRGARWMESRDGLRRDIDVIRTLAKAAPAGTRLMADANNQFGLGDTQRFLGEVGEHIFFIEEPFDENLEDGRTLRKWIADNHFDVLLADGESEHDPAKLFDLADRGGLDVLQPDIRALGLTLQSRLAQAVSGHTRLKLAPHCWGSYLGTYKMLHLARGAPGILTCEIDHMTSDLFDDTLWTIRDGTVVVPDVPGTGLAFREDVFERCYLSGAWQVGDTRPGHA
jgi:L-alanine-DL-glutamate epimerase-like enolase superfamily enzyme